jgi:hypothetical protein
MFIPPLPRAADMNIGESVVRQFLTFGKIDREDGTDGSRLHSEGGP